MTFRWLTIPLLVSLTACSTNNQKPTEQTEKVLYNSARDALEDRSYLVAQERYKTLETLHPFGEYTEQAQLETMYLHYEQNDMESLLAKSERFIRMYPLHPSADYAYYLRGVAAYEMGYGALVVKYLSDGNADRDVTPLQDAFQYFSDLLVRFPDSPYTADAQARMIFIRERLASQHVEIARYYMKRHAYVAAANRCETVVTQFPRTRANGDALALMVEAYRHMDMPQEADKALVLLETNYPDHLQLTSGQFVATDLPKTDRRSWLELVTLGLAK